MQRITYQNMCERLLKAVPELKTLYEADVKWWSEEKQRPHVFYGDLLAPYITSLIDKGQNEAILKRIFDFLEILANHQDKHIQEVVAFSICEYFLHKKAWLEKARKYMGPTTLRFSREVQNFWQSKEMQRRDDWDDM